VLGPVLGQPVVELAFDDIQDTGVRTDEGREVGSRHHQAPYGFDGRDAGGSHSDLQPAAFAHELARAAFGENPLPAVLIDADPGLTFDDHDHIVRGIALSHEPVAGVERYPPRHR
jgi:hypothetical protein